MLDSFDAVRYASAFHLTIPVRSGSSDPENADDPHVRVIQVMRPVQD